MRVVSLLASFYFGSNHFDEFVDVVGCDDAAFLQYQFDAFAQFGTCCGCEERGCGSAYGSAEYECEKTFHVVGRVWLFYFLDFFGNLVGKAFKFLLLDSGYVAADKAFDGVAGFAAFLGREKECGCRAYEGASESCDDNGKSFHCGILYRG